MHDEALAFVHDNTYGVHWPHVLDIGGANVNGTPRPFIQHDTWWVVDIAPGRGVDEVADAARWSPPQMYDLVLCLEVFEHTPEWPLIVRTLALAVKNAGTVLITAACDPRPPHDAYGADAPPPPGQYYGNVNPEDLADVVMKYFANVWVDVLPRGDVRVRARL